MGFIQEPIKRSVQLPYFGATAFSQGLFSFMSKKISSSCLAASRPFYCLFSYLLNIDAWAFIRYSAQKTTKLLHESSSNSELYYSCNIY